LISIILFIALSYIKNEHGIDLQFSEFLSLWLWIIIVVILFCSAIIPTLAICKKEIAKKIEKSIYKLYLKTNRAKTISSIFKSSEVKMFEQVTIISLRLDELKIDHSDYVSALHNILSDGKRINIYVSREVEHYHICKKRIKEFINNCIKNKISTQNIKIYAQTDYFRFLVQGLIYVLLRHEAVHYETDLLNEKLYMGINVGLNIGEKRNAITVKRYAANIEDKNFIDEITEKLDNCIEITSEIICIN
jgi:hypothetical protein